jgi:hypothetical protein
MARFKYMGEPVRAGITYGPTTKLKLKKKDGTTQELSPVSPATEFAIDADIGYDITDSRSLHQLRVDTRFQEIP